MKETLANPTATAETLEAENLRLRKALALIFDDSDFTRHHELSLEQRLHAVHVTAETALTYPDLDR